MPGASRFGFKVQGLVLVSAVGFGVHPGAEGLLGPGACFDP